MKVIGKRYIAINNLLREDVSQQSDHVKTLLYSEYVFDVIWATNIEGHMHGICVPDESNEYQHYSCSEAILAQLVPKLPCICMHTCANSYICTQDVPVGERDNWMHEFLHT